MTNTPWAHLPNAEHIDGMIEHARVWPDTWEALKHSTWYGDWASLRRTAYSAIWPFARKLGKDAELEAALSAVRKIVQEGALDAALWGGLFALMVCPDSATLLDCAPDVLRAMIDLAEPPVRHLAVLLLPYAIARSNDTPKLHDVTWIINRRTLRHQ